MVQVAAFDVSVIDKEKLLSPRLFGVFRLSYVAFYVDMRRIFVTGDQLTLVAFSKNTHNPLTEFS